MSASSEQLRLSEREWQQWREQGYFVRHRQFAHSELDALRRAAERAAARADAKSTRGRTYFLDNKRFVDVDHATVQYEHTPGSTTVRVLEPANLFDDRIDRLVDDPRLTTPMQALVGSTSLSLWTAKLNMKSGAGSGFGWHQDSPYWMHDCGHVDQLPNVMLALDEQRLDNGCFRIIPGSHKRGILPGTADGSQLGGFYTDPGCFDTADEVAMEVDAGALIFFDAHTVHGSAANESNKPRRALIFTYQPGGFPMLKTGAERQVDCEPPELGCRDVTV